MKKIKFLLLSIFICHIFSANIFAHTLEEITQNLSKNEITCGDFTQIKTINTSKGSRDIKSNGTFVLSPDGIMWNTIKPIASKMIITETKIIQIDAKNNKNIIDGTDNATFASISATISTVFKNDLAMLKEKFTLFFSEAENDTWKLELSPKDSTIASVIKTFFLQGSASGSKVSLDSLEIVESNGGQIKYFFSNQQYTKNADYKEMMDLLR